jgi:hypothetical protein
MHWLLPVIPTTWEVEVKRITVPGQLGPKVGETTTQSISPGVWHMPVIPAIWEAIGKRTMV